MNGNVIENLLYGLSCFKGVYACNELPDEPFASPFAVVVNTDPIEEAGEHWVALISKRSDTVQYFDSYGHIPINPEIYRFMLNFKHKEVCDFHFQSYLPTSDVCGFFVVLFIKCRCIGMSTIDFKTNFTDCPILNDLLVQIYTAATL